MRGYKFDSDLKACGLTITGDHVSGFDTKTIVDFPPIPLDPCAHTKPGLDLEMYAYARAARANRGLSDHYVLDLLAKEPDMGPRRRLMEHVFRAGLWSASHHTPGMRA